MDDDDFHARQYPLSLENNRAVAAVLCNLAFHNCYNKTSLPAQERDAPEWLPVVDQYFPTLLRRLYERDNRSAYCPPGMWLAPFNKNISTDKTNLVAPAILQGLLHRSTSAIQTASMAFLETCVWPLVTGDTVISSSAAHVIGLCSLLLTAPQCVPFSNRVEIFRELVKADKERLGLHIPYSEGGPHHIKAPSPSLTSSMTVFSCRSLSTGIECLRMPCSSWAEWERDSRGNSLSPCLMLST